MLKKIRIQNFRSLEDITLDFQDVNLLIGPNNSGKSNLFKAFEFLGMVFNNQLPNNKEDLEKYFFLKRINDYDYPDHPPISFSLLFEITEKSSFLYKIDIYGFSVTHHEIIFSEFFGTFKKDFKGNRIKDIDISHISQLRNDFVKFSLENINNSKFNDFLEITDPLQEHTNSIENNSFSLNWVSKKGDTILKRRSSARIGKLLESNSEYLLPSHIKKVFLSLKNVNTFSINISTLKEPYPTLEEDYSVKNDASNLVAFLDNMDDSHPDIINRINENLSECIEEFKSIVFQKVKLSDNHPLKQKFGRLTFKKIGVRDIYGQTYWAEELSDGTLYFLALLAIIHQPNPPKLLLLEEPENGIHPRRIKEIVDYLFELAESKGVQIILTTHSTVVIDQFVDYPESIFVFDKPEKSTTIKNLQYDIIAEDKRKSKELSLPEIDLSESLGDHWASGLIGGVPK